MNNQYFTHNIFKKFNYFYYYYLYLISSFLHGIINEEEKTIITLPNDKKEIKNKLNDTPSKKRNDQKINYCFKCFNYSEIVSMVIVSLRKDLLLREKELSVRPSVNSKIKTRLALIKKTGTRHDGVTERRKFKKFKISARYEGANELTNND